jgi:hypothetical protein
LTLPITELRVTVPKALDICDDVLPSNHMRVNVPIISSVQIKGVLHFAKPSQRRRSVVNAATMDSIP